MIGLEAFTAAFVGGLHTSASPRALAAAPVAVGHVGGRGATRQGAALPANAQGLIRRIAPIEPWFPGRRLFASLLVVAGLWWIAQEAIP